MDPSEVTILVVEDDEFTRMATIDILRSCRYTVSAVENGQDAYNILHSNPDKYDLVLCDVMLPVMNGIQLLECMMKNDNQLTHIPVVMTSSNEEMDVVTSCLSKGAKDYLIKPIQVNTAKTLVRHVWLSRQQDLRMDSGNVARMYPSNSLWQDLEIIRSIGKGTHGNVLLAKRRIDGAIVAVKRVQTSQISESGKKQADNEVVLLQSLYHVNIVRFYDHFMIGDELNIVMEYSDGGNLRQLVKMRSREKMGPFPEAVIMSWFAQLVLAVAYIHGKNVLHRDLKAQNVFLTRKNVVKLGDFGISKALSGDVTATTACGTPESMSPEICRGESYGKKSDVWSLGCILYEMIMLKRPFEAKTLPDIFTKICKGEYIPVPQSVWSRELRLLVQLMLQLDATKRPTIEDICRFPFVQGPIQAFLSEHVAEFQEALELEAKLHQPSLYTTQNTVLSPISPSLKRRSQVAVSPKVEGIVDPRRIEGIKDVSWSDTLLDKLRLKMKVQTIRVGFFTSYPACVTGDQVRQCLQRILKTEEDKAKEILNDLVSKKALNVVASEGTSVRFDAPTTYLRFQMDEAFVPLNKKYNCSAIVDSTPIELCIEVSEFMGTLHRDVRFPDGISTGFPTVQKSPIHSSTKMEGSRVGLSGRDDVLLSERYRKYLRLSAKLQKIDLQQLAKHDRQAFFINLYNTMVLHGFIEFGIPQNSGQYRAFEKDVEYQVGEYCFTLGDIKHGIIRCNRKPPSHYWDRQLQPQDPRLQFRLHIRDPRSLLVLVDSCEPIPEHDHIAIIRSGRTDTDLEEQVEKYCARNVKISEVAQEIELPRIFKVFRDDFGAAESDMISWLLQYFKNPLSNLIAYRVRYTSGISC